ncbi:MAG: flagellar basal body rod protein FlgC [bacterium]|nr:flagellar basal body rod protein FlgC [bacterium]
MGGIINAIEISSRGLSAQRSKMNAIAQNMANAETTETAEGGPYRRKQVIISEDTNTRSFSNVLGKASTNLARTHSGHRTGNSLSAQNKTESTSVDHREIEDSMDNFRLVHDPNHPNADEDGFVKMPNIDVITEMVDMMTASRAYEANTAVISAAKKMANDAMDI